MQWDLSAWLQLSGTPYQNLPALLSSLGIGLLIGVERERKHHVLAGIRTFPLVCLLGTLLAMLLPALGSAWLPAAGLLAVAGLGFLPHGSRDPDEPNEPRTTTVIALLVAYTLGLMVGMGNIELAVALGIITTGLLYLKPELSSLTQQLDRHDLLSLLQFATLTFIILPLLPNQGFGPYLAFNPHRIWLLVVLIVGVGLAGYLAVKLLGEKVGAPLLGFMGGLVSTTATSLVYAREAASNPGSQQLATRVILLANMVLFLRLQLLTVAIAPQASGGMLLVMLPGMALGLLTIFISGRRGQARDGAPELELKNPAQLRIALGFAALFAVVMLCSAWLKDLFGDSGLYMVALVSGINDVDAISLTVMELFGKQLLPLQPLLITVVIAVLANTVFKMGLIFSIGGRALALRCLPTFIVAMLGMLGGLWFATL
ncbi:MgtC/SapB family protein [Vogesella oryzae]|uniref:MgtC/SapB family protein n=1 Tax=Vogesella oryzae TaxID=1735285 RepID=UPI001581EE85|nr:MgtC/SapB family protein [Vogesella oryzae]